MIEHLRKTTAVIALAFLGMANSSAQTRYAFKATDYVSTDNNRAPQSAFINYTLSGTRVSTPQKGIYIAKQGNKTQKKIIK